MANMGASDLAGQRIRQFRQQHEWTAKELADRCAEIGAPHITATVITNLETRRRASRQITVDEALVLAYVLEVPPILLFLPLSDGEHLEITPSISTDPVSSVLWLSGLSASPDIAGGEQRRRREVVDAFTVLPVNLLLDIWAQASFYLWMTDRLARDDPPFGIPRDTAERSIANVPDRLAKALNLMLARGLTPPRLPRRLVEDLRARKVLLHPDEVPVWGENAEQPDWLTNPEAALEIADFPRRLFAQISDNTYPRDSRDDEVAGGEG